MNPKYDVIVIGGGHAGAEAAHAAARLGARTALITISAQAIGRMSCNPAIGGLGKGQMVCEIDALGGLMGRAIDATGIQFRLLNMRKGPAVRAPRAQADREAYAGWVGHALQATPHLDIVEGVVDRIETEPGSDSHPLRTTGVLLQDGRRIAGQSVIVTTGTFLKALMHCGTRQTPGGRVGEPAATGMSACLLALGLELGRLKTGTPPRVHRDSLDYDRLEPQPGDDPPTPFSFLTERIDQPQINCWITYTNAETHRLIRDNLHVAPMYNGQIQSGGPRYCPSIEDKVVRFADKPRHQLFLEPEGYDNERVYCNGISTSLPAEIQDQLIRSVPGLEQARILQPGYAVEYDFVPTHQIRPSLEVKRVCGLFLAGQINGTSGYEEAGAQGLIAGINAVRKLADQEPVVLGRHEAYIGVMIDDLVTRPPTEPYRMFTSRAEYRLCLRYDNADQRLTPLGREVGLVDDNRWKRFTDKSTSIERLQGLTDKLPWQGVTLSRWLARPDASEADLRAALNDHQLETGTTNGVFTDDAIRQVFVASRYRGYLDRQTKQIERFAQMEETRIPERLDFANMPELRLEAREKFARHEPRTLGQAARISGINPSDITILWLYTKGRSSRTSSRIDHPSPNG